MVITINRPEARNAVNGAVSIVVGDALEEAHDNPDVRAVVITGAGDKWGIAGYRHHFIDKPTSAAVSGTALDDGAEPALASDLVVADEHT